MIKNLVSIVILAAIVFCSYWLGIKSATTSTYIVKPISVEPSTCVVEVRYRNKETHIWEGKRKIANTTY